MKVFRVGKIKTILGGGFIFYFHPEAWGFNQFWQICISNGLVQPPPSISHPVWSVCQIRIAWFLQFFHVESWNNHDIFLQAPCMKNHAKFRMKHFFDIWNPRKSLGSSGIIKLPIWGDQCIVWVGDIMTPAVDCKGPFFFVAPMNFYYHIFVGMFVNWQGLGTKIQAGWVFFKLLECPFWGVAYMNLVNPDQWWWLD